MKKLKLVEFSLKHPVAVIVFSVIITLIMASFLPRVQYDNDPENMLAKNEPIRLFHEKIKKQYSLYDFVIVGIVNEKNENGVFNVETLNNVYNLTAELQSLHKDKNGKTCVIKPSAHSAKKEKIYPDLKAKNALDSFLNFVFRHNPEKLFHNGESAIISREIISPSAVDNLRQAELGSLKVEYLMEKPISTNKEAAQIQTDAMNNPLYKDTIVSKNGKALCLYIPIKEKVYSYNVAHLVKQLTKDWKHDKVYITGLPVAEDTFGVQMLKQMAISAPLAGLMIFLMLWFFFRKMGLILAPLIIAIMSVICTMGLLIGLGFKVHIMSSMIAIFLMPIAVVDSVHILSEFFDVHHKFNDEKEAIRHVVGHLFIPMLYTSLTTAAGFASLATAPIPPVQVFGLHVAFGVVLAWVLTMTFVPAFILLFVSEKSLKKFNSTEKDSKKSTTMEHFLKATGDFTYLRWKLILVVTAIILGISIFGITKIHINDNPVKWFTKNHSVRVADRVLNKHFGGTYTAYLTLASVKSEKLTCQEKLHKFKQAVANKFEKSRPDTVRGFYEILENLSKKFGNVKTCSPDKCFVSLIEQSKVLDASYSQEWSNLADKINYMEIENLTYETLKKRSRKFKNIDEEKLAVLLKSLKNYPKKQGEPLLNKALDICDKFLKNSLVNFLYKANVKFAAPLFKKPKILHYVEKLEDFLSETGEVGKVSSVVDALKKANYELQYIKTKTNKENHLNYSIPPSPAAIGQVFIQLEGMKKKDFLFHFVTKDYQETNLWVQLKSGDNRDMQLVVQKLNDYIKENPPPSGIEAKWAGLTYLNVVWQEKMVAGTLASLGSSFIIVFLMMLLLFRSVIFGLLSMIPLSVTIAFIYGLIGLAGKDYDMPVAILSSLTLGLSVDFAIHFLERAREAYKQEQSWQKAVGIMFANPASAISRNAIVIAIGFTPLLLAPLVPYKTVGFFLATIMAVSAVGTLLILPALLTMLQKIAFKQKKED